LPKESRDPSTLALQRRERHEEALAAYDRALLYARRMYPALLNKGATLYSMGKKEDALKVFDELLRLYPNDPQGLNNRGLVLRSLGRTQEAMEAFDAVSSLDPTWRHGEQDSLLTDCGNRGSDLRLEGGGGRSEGRTSGCG
jgi:tetratricopeptide (TPR) repeat protein